MNIQIITSSYPAYPDDPSGTAGLFVRAFALELQKQGHRVVVQPVARKGCYRPDAGLAIEPLPWRGGDRELASMSWAYPGNWLTFCDFFRGARASALRVHAQYEIDRTLCMWAVPAGLLGYWIKRDMDKPYDVWALGSDIWKTVKVPIFGKLLLKKILGGADRVFADGLGLCRDVEKISCRSCAFLPSSRELPAPRVADQKGDDAKRVKLLFVGRYHHNKGPDILLEAVRQLPQSVKARLRLDMYGVGPLKESLSDYASRHHLEQHVSIHGGISSQSLADELSRATYLIIPSRIESIPVIFSDALQVGTPIIAAPVGDLKCLIEEHGCGILADNSSAEALARAIEKACHCNLRESQAIKAQELCNRFKVSETVRKWLVFRWL